MNNRGEVRRLARLAHMRQVARRFESGSRNA